jgi:hypothetical protein
MKPHYDSPLDDPKVIKPHIQSEQIGILEPEEDNGEMRFSAQYWLAPVLVVSSDPFCCDMLIAHASFLPVVDYEIVEPINGDWYLLERK